MIFEVTPEDIEKLSDTDLRILIGQLAEQEMVQQGHSAAYVTYGGHQNASDGGIDVRVSLADSAATSGFVPRSQTGYQVKAENMAAAAIKKEMRPKGKIRQSILDLIAAKGAYIIVSSKGSLADTALSERKAAMIEALEGIAEKDDLLVEFYDRRRIATWVNQHPPLKIWVREKAGRAVSGWKPFKDWSSSPTSVEDDYLADETVRLVDMRSKEGPPDGIISGINKLRTIVAKPKGAIRLVGLSGVGKTRLVQALFDAKIGEHALDKAIVVYADLADDPDPVPQHLFEQIQATGKRCIFIVDNCSIALHRKLAAAMKTVKSSMSVITIEYDIADDEAESTEVFKLEPASSEVVERIVHRHYPNLSSPELHTIAKFSEGNARIALALAETAQDGDSLADLKDSDLFKRLFRQNHEDNPALMKAAKVCSLVYSFNGQDLESADAEMPILAILAEQSITEFHGHIAELHRRQLVQRRSVWRAFLPHALAQRLAKQVLQDTPPAILKNDFFEKLPSRLLRSFSRRIGTLHDSPEAQAIVKHWLSDGGDLSDIEHLSPIGLSMLENIAPVDPHGVLRVITLANAKGSLGNNGNLRYSIVRLLRSIAYDPKCFFDAAKILGELSIETLETNNASDAGSVFPSLFQIYLSGTQAPPAMRAELLRNLAQTLRSDMVEVVLSGLTAMLKTDHFTSSYGFEFGARKRDYGWHPVTSEDVSKWYGEGLKLIKDLEKLPLYRERIRNLVAKSFQYLVGHTGLFQEFAHLAEAFSKDGGWPEGWAAVRSAARRATRKKDSSALKKLNELAIRLKPSSLSERIGSYVLPEQWGSIDVAEIDFEDEEKYEKSQRHVEEVCRSIGEELANDFSAFKKHVRSLMSANSTRPLVVVETIGEKAGEPQKYWAEIVAALTPPNEVNQQYYVSGAFLSGLAKTNTKLADDLLEQALTLPQLHKYVIPMQSMVGLDDINVERIIRALDIETVPTRTLNSLRHGRACQKVTAPQMLRLLDEMCQRADGFSLAIDILHMRLFATISDKLPITADEANLGVELLKKGEFKRQDGDYVLIST